MDVLRIAGIICLVILSFVISASVPPLLIAHSAKEVVFNAAFYEGQFEKYGLYDKIRDTAIDSLSNMGGGNIGEEGNAITDELKASLKERIKAAIPTSWVKAQANGMLENLLSFLKGEKDNLELKISLEEIKPNIVAVAENVTEEEMGNAAEKQLNETLGGNAAQFDALLASGIGPGGCSSIADCIAYCSRPENIEECNNISKELGLPPLGTLESATMTNVSEMIDEQIPDEIDIGKEMEKSGSYQSIVNARDTLKIVFLVTDILWLVPIGAILFIVIITRNAKDACGWIGGALLTAGIMTLLVAFLVPVAAEKMVEKMAQPTGEGAEFAAIIKDVMTALIGTIFGGVMIPAGAIAVAGLVLLISSRLLKKESGSPTKNAKV